MLQEATALFIEGWREEGIMDRVLEETGLTPATDTSGDERS